MQTKVRYKDLTGQRFGRLQVISPTDKRADHGSVVWVCQCDCGEKVEVSGRRLTLGKVRSCGCLSRPQLKDYVGKTFGRLTVISYAGKRRIIREHSAVTINLWRCRCDCGNERIITQPELEKGNTLSCGCYKRDLLLQSMILYQNTSVAVLERNKKGKRKNNTSGHTGVYQDKSGRWIAYINFQKKRYWLGRYEKKEDAIKAREKGEEMHEEFLEWWHKTYDKK